MIRNQPYIVVVVIAVIAGIIAVIGASFWLRNYEADKVTKIVIASKNIASGDVLSRDNVILSERPAANLPSASLLEISPLMGRVAKTDMLDGDVIHETSLVPMVIDGSLAAAISPGKRAISLRVTEEGSVAGFILPGNYIDIIANSKDSIGKPISKFLLENVLVLATAQERNKANKAEPKVVGVITLELTPEQAEKLDLAHVTSNLTLVLRNQMDKALAPEVTPNPIEVIPLAPNVYPRAVRAPASVEIIRGTIRQ
jgi:pilus assembly protein CpaB